MPDRIELRSLRIMGVCGALLEERERAQPLELDLDVFVDLTAAGASDRLEDTVDYGALCSLVERTVASSDYVLLEALAERVAAEVLAWRGVERVTVSVRKLRPPVAQDLATSGVRITRPSDRPGPCAG